MGWVWNDDGEDWRSTSVGSGDLDDSRNPNLGCSTRRTVKSQCKTEEIEPGKFVRKCEKTEQILKDCVGRPTEVVQSTKEYTEEDVTDDMNKGSLSLGSPETRPFEFPGLRSDIEAIERSLFGGISRFFDAAEEMRNGFFSGIDSPPLNGRPSRPPSLRRGIPTEDHHSPNSPSVKTTEPDSGSFDLSGLAQEV